MLEDISDEPHSTGWFKLEIEGTPTVKLQIPQEMATLQPTQAPMQPPREEKTRSLVTAEWLARQLPCWVVR